MNHGFIIGLCILMEPIKMFWLVTSFRIFQEALQHYFMCCLLSFIFLDVKLWKACAENRKYLVQEEKGGGVRVCMWACVCVYMHAGVRVCVSQLYSAVYTYKSALQLLICSFAGENNCGQKWCIQLSPWLSMQNWACAQFADANLRPKIGLPTLGLFKALEHILSV